MCYIFIYIYILVDLILINESDLLHHFFLHFVSYFIEIKLSQRGVFGVGEKEETVWEIVISVRRAANREKSTKE